MKVIQHDAQSLRQAAIQRFLNTRHRIDIRYKRRALGALLIVLAKASVLSVILLIRFHAG